MGKKLRTALYVSLAFATALPAAAQTVAPSGTLVNPLQATSLTQLISEVLGAVVVLGSIFLTVMLIYVGFLFVSARGNEEAVGKARAALLWTVIGGVLLLGAQAIALVIANTATSL